MKKIILIGRSGVGQTTLKQALRKEKIEYKKKRPLRERRGLSCCPQVGVSPGALGRRPLFRSLTVLKKL